jgi:phospholipid/cholesterol/gamma-HCH transport system ATP-binding protein
MIEFKGLHKSFGDAHVLRGMDLAIQPGEVMFIIGTSGVGKSVTIKHLVGLLRPDAGEVWLDGQRIDQLPERDFYAVRKRCAMVFQHATLFDTLTLTQNVALPLRKHQGLRGEAAEQAALELLDAVGIRAYADRLPAELGDGMRKRAAIARALALAPTYVLFDEPTTGLDPVSARRIDRLIRELAEKRNVTCVVVSHDLTSIFGIADRIAMLYQGRTYALGTPAELRTSTDPIVQQFISGRSSGLLETPGF